MEIKALVKALLAARRWRQADLAGRLGVDQSMISRWLAGVEPRGHTRDKLRELAAESGIGVEDRRDHVLPVMGYVGAGDVVDTQGQWFDAPLEEVELPYPIDDDLVGFAVRGDSMRPKYGPGEILVVEREQPFATESMVGEMAVVRTYDDVRLVKRIMPGPRPHTYNLESINADTLVGVRIRWASPIRMIIPNIGLRWLAKKSEKNAREPAARSPRHRR